MKFTNTLPVALVWTDEHVKIVPVINLYKIRTNLFLKYLFYLFETCRSTKDTGIFFNKFFLHVWWYRYSVHWDPHPVIVIRLWKPVSERLQRWSDWILALTVSSVTPTVGLVLSTSMGVSASTSPGSVYKIYTSSATYLHLPPVDSECGKRILNQTRKYCNQCCGAEPFFPRLRLQVKNFGSG